MLDFFTVDKTKFIYWSEYILNTFQRFVYKLFVSLRGFMGTKLNTANFSAQVKEALCFKNFRNCWCI